MFVRDYAVGQYTLRIFLGDITELAVDALVNSENEDMRMDHADGRSVSAAIRRKGGEAIARELARQGPIPLGSVRVTAGGGLAAPYVLHPAVVWERHGVRYTDARVLETATRQTLNLAEAMGLTSLAMPAFGVGTARYPAREAGRILVRGILDFFATGPKLSTVILAILDPRIFASIFEETLAQALAGAPPLVVTVASSRDKLTVTADDGAHARLSEREVDPADVALVRERFGDVFSYHGRLATNARLELEGVGSFLMDTLLGSEVRAALGSAPDRPVLFRLAPPVLNVPWELAYDGADFVCRRHPAARQVLNTRVRTPRAMPTSLRALVVSDPCGDLPGAAEEARHLLDQLAGGNPERVTVDLYGGARADLSRVLAACERADLVHFAGHLTDGTAPGWKLANHALHPERMASRPNAPLLAFASACGPGAHPMDERPHQLARGFLDAGVANYLAALVPVHDRAGGAFTRAFYHAWLAGTPLGECVRRARAAVASRHGEDELYWASFVLYGDPNVRWTATLGGEA